MKTEGDGGGENRQTKVHTFKRINNDKRMLAAADLYQQYNNDAFLVYKTTRAGCTTALVAESINRDETFTTLVPTNLIAKDTIIEDAQKYADVPVRNITSIPSNHKCKKNENLIERYPVLDFLPVLPLADDCMGCKEYQTCPVTEVLRKPESNGFVLTYSKLVALMLASRQGFQSRAQEILDIIDKSKNFVFDEAHELQYGRSTSVTVYQDGNGTKNFDIDRYLDVMDEFSSINKLLLTFSKLIRSSEMQQSIHEVYNAASHEDYWNKHLRNTHYNTWKSGEMDNPKFSMACYKEIMEIAKNKNKYNLTVLDILSLYRILNIVIGDKFSVHAIVDRKRDKINVKLTTQDWFYIGMISSFLMSIENNENKILLTSATVCSYDYSQHFMKNGPRDVFFGGNGDPMNTNENLLVIADTKKTHRGGKDSIWKKKDEILTQV
jgi:hypothetical protein